MQRAFFLGAGVALLVAASFLSAEAVAPSVLTGTCTPGANPRVTLSWTAVPGSTSNALQKGDCYPSDPGAFWCFIDIGATVYTYTDTDLQPNTVYQYRVKNDAPTPSNVFVCDTTAAPPPPPPPPEQNPPSVALSPVTNLSTTWARLVGTVNPKGSATSYYFLYGTSQTALSGQTQNGAAGSGTTNIAVGITASGLTPNTLYYFKLIAANAVGISETTSGTFRTRASTAPPPPPPPPSTPPTSTPPATPPPSTPPSTPPPPPSPPPPPRPTFSVEPSVRTVGTGGTTSFQAMYDPDGSGPQAKTNVSAEASWSIENTAIAEYRGGGEFAAKKIGQTSVRVSYRNLSVGASLRVIQGGTKPNVRTTSATNIRASYATLQGLVNPNGAPTSAWFEYGETSALGRATKKRAVGSTAAWAPIIEEVFLQAGAEYFYRVAAQNAFGTIYGATVKLNSAGSPELILEPASAEVNAGDLAPFTAWYDADGSGPALRKNVTADALWLSSDTTTAFHESSGGFRAGAGGEAAISVYYNSAGPVTNINEITNVSAESILTVNQPETEPVAVLALPTTTPTSSNETAPSPWRVIGLIFAIVAVIGAIGTGAWYLKRRFADEY